MESLQAEFNYRKPLKKTEEKPAFGLSEEDPNMPSHKAFTKQVHNARRSDLVIETGGFELINHKSSVKDFYNDDEVVGVYYREMSEHVKEKVGADDVQIFSHITRSEAQADSGERKGGHRLVHNDFTTNFGKTIDPFLQEMEFKPKKVIVFNLWRRFDQDGLDTPFAVCDKRTVSEEELIPTDLFNYIKDQPDALTVEIYQSSNNDKHKWYFYPKMNRDEVLMFKTFDSTEKPFLPTLHSAFDDPSFKDQKVSPRESIEVRAMCFFK
jgi:hypothetical protein|tara:strand:- start:2580 stop:3380 length:801 start_codon:yes stop_codon:yes gene_type:complete